jgi:hypothetical protein
VGQGQDLEGHLSLIAILLILFVGIDHFSKLILELRQDAAFDEFQVSNQSKRSQDLFFSFHCMLLSFLEQFRSRKADMLCGYVDGFCLCGSDQCTAGQMIGFSKKPAGALMDCYCGSLVEKIGGDAGKVYMVDQVVSHGLDV